MNTKQLVMPFEKGRLYSRRDDIHAMYGGQQQGGISTPTKSDFVFLFTGGSGEQHGYSDGWDEEGVFHYSGEGQYGDMTFVRGNRAIRDHAAAGKDLLLFENLGKGRPVRFMGVFSCASWEYSETPDTDGAQRQSIVFHLLPVDAWPEISDEIAEAAADEGVDLSVLRERALAASATPDTADSKGSKRRYYKRSKAVKDYVLARASGVCECCSKPAPFTRVDGTAYLEPHHIKRRSDFGPDHPRWVAGICPNCHREIHFGKNGDQLNTQLSDKLFGIEDD